MVWGVNLILFGGWFFVFWFVGRVILEVVMNYVVEGIKMSYIDIIFYGSFECVGVVGIFLMVFFVGFVFVLILWYVFGVRKRKKFVIEVDI